MRHSGTDAGVGRLDQNTTSASTATATRRNWIAPISFAFLRTWRRIETSPLPRRTRRRVPSCFCTVRCSHRAAAPRRRRQRQDAHAAPGRPHVRRGGGAARPAGRGPSCAGPAPARLGAAHHGGRTFADQGRRSCDPSSILVRDGKGAKDRLTMLADRLRPALGRQMEDARRLYAADLGDGFGAVWLPTRSPASIRGRRENGPRSTVSRRPPLGRSA